jgi:hypothetical protein
MSSGLDDLAKARTRKADHQAELFSRLKELGLTRPSSFLAAAANSSIERRFFFQVLNIVSLLPISAPNATLL